MTGCARFFIFLLIFTPAVLIGVSYFNGNNPLEQIKDLLGIEKVEQRSNNNQTDTTYKPSTSDVSNENILKSTIETQKSTINDLQEKVKSLESTLSERNKEIQYLKQQRGNE